MIIHGRYKKLNEWIISVKVRDNYTCQKCNKEKLKGMNCIAHHIKSK